jgi:hypothetical protein
MNNIVTIIFFSMFYCLFCSCQNKKSIYKKEVILPEHIQELMMTAYGLNKYNLGYHIVDKSTFKYDSLPIISCYPRFVPELSVDSTDSRKYFFSWEKGDTMIEGRSSMIHTIYTQKGMITSVGKGGIIIPIKDYNYIHDIPFKRELVRERDNLNPWLLEKAKKKGLIK